MTPTILTIGHSRHTIERFIALVESAGVTAIVDVHSAPASRFSPQFNQKALAATLAARGVDYLFLGKELGGRPERTELYTRGVADYEKMRQRRNFAPGSCAWSSWRSGIASRQCAPRPIRSTVTAVCWSAAL